MNASAADCRCDGAGRPTPRPSSGRPRTAAASERRAGGRGCRPRRRGGGPGGRRARGRPPRAWNRSRRRAGPRGAAPSGTRSSSTETRRSASAARLCSAPPLSSTSRSDRRNGRKAWCGVTIKARQLNATADTTVISHIQSIAAAAVNATKTAVGAARSRASAAGSRRSCRTAVTIPTEKAATRSRRPRAPTSASDSRYNECASRTNSARLPRSAHHASYDPAPVPQQRLAPESVQAGLPELPPAASVRRQEMRPDEVVGGSGGFARRPLERAEALRSDRRRRPPRWRRLPTAATAAMPIRRPGARRPRKIAMSTRVGQASRQAARDQPEQCGAGLVATCRGCRRCSRTPTAERPLQPRRLSRARPPRSLPAATSARG